MARALIVGCGARGRALGERLLADGWAVRGTSRREEGLATIEAAGIEPALADPEWPGTLLDLVADVAAVVFVLGSASGERENLEAIHGPRLEGLVERLVDTPVRAIVYEGSGSVDPELLAGGAETLRRANRTWRIPIAIVEADSADTAAWVEAMAGGLADAFASRG